MGGADLAQLRPRFGLQRPVLERCDDEKLPAYLEATSPRTRALYERHGFEVTGQFSAGHESLPAWRMWRTPTSKPQRAQTSSRRRLNGKLPGFWYAVGDHDGYSLIEAPDDIAASVLLKAASGGAFPPRLRPRS